MQHVTLTLRESNPKAYDAAMTAVCAGLMLGQEGANYKGQLALLLYPAVQKIVGEDNAAQVTGDLVELPLEQIIGFMRSEFQLRACVDQAFDQIKGAAVESESEQGSVTTADESAAAAAELEPEQKAPVAPMNWQSMFNAIADPTSKPARIVKKEEEKKNVRAKTIKSSKPAREPTFKYVKLEWPVGVQKADFLRRQGVFFNPDDVYYNCTHCEVELNFTSDPERALVHCNRVGHQQNRAHNLSLKKGYRGRRQ